MEVILFFYPRSDYWVNDKAVNPTSTNPEK